MPTELLTTSQMYAADAAALAAGIPGIRLMERAGHAVAESVIREMGGRCGPVLILCGPGNNGGDGFVAARHLLRAGWPVTVGLLGERDALRGDAALAAAVWPGPVLPATADLLPGHALIVDALFGAGLSRPLTGGAAALVTAIARSGVPVVAVDVPSGVCGDDGQVLGAAAPARRTVTFCRRKPGHLLFPGRQLCGVVDLVDIGIPADLLAGLSPLLHANAPALWRAVFPTPAPTGHKYQRGHLLMLGGAVMTGAARLAARAAMRIGAGLVTLACAPEMYLLYSLSQASLLISPVDSAQQFQALLADTRRNAVLLGPGGGTAGPAGDLLRQATLDALAADRSGVLDGDVFSVFADRLSDLCLAGLDDQWVLTPHEGEFHRLFGELPGGRLQRAQAAAARSGAVIVLKGPDTVIAHPDGRAIINENAPADLATAGSGDVLAGMIAGLITQGMPAFMAAAAGCWLHGESGRSAGPGLLADDLPETLPTLLAMLRQY